MNLISWAFALFTLGTLALFSLAPARARLWLLLAASYVFLASHTLDAALIFAILTLVNFALGPRLLPSAPRGAFFLRVGLGVNLLALVYFKYAGFWVRELGGDSEALRILLPIGLSFYVLQAIGYLLDVRRGLTPPAPRLAAFALYMAWFPRLTAGPLERPSDFLPQLEALTRPTTERLTGAFNLILQGLVRKVLIADTLALLMPADVFSAPREQDGGVLALSLLLYAALLYNDFAGYTAIVRGVSLLFGLTLSPNFNAPYLARSFGEFWGRWHMSLSAWLRDYVFTPTLRALLRRKYTSRHPLTVILPPLLTMLVSGLWHEASPNLLLWGGVHGLFQVVERAQALRRPSQAPDAYPLWRQGLSWGLVFSLTLLAWLPFRLPLPSAWGYLQTLFTATAWSDFQHGLNDFSLGLLFILLGLSLLLDLAQVGRGEGFYLRLQPWARAVLITGALYGLVFALGLQGEATSPFIYAAF
jgi:D-alanyl-lipoteichoic acid acyltransferase DltB (MBOAT superfamily)